MQPCKGPQNLRAHVEVVATALVVNDVFGFVTRLGREVIWT